MNTVRRQLTNFKPQLISLNILQASVRTRLKLIFCSIRSYSVIHWGIFMVSAHTTRVFVCVACGAWKHSLTFKRDYNHSPAPPYTSAHSYVTTERTFFCVPSSRIYSFKEAFRFCSFLNILFLKGTDVIFSIKVNNLQFLSAKIKIYF
jgi:hypothetical protein